MARTKDELRDEAREYITGCLAKGITEIEQPAGLWAEVREVFGPRHTIFSAAEWGWLNKALADHRELAESLARGLADSAAGRTSDLGDFTQYADLADELVIDDDGPLAGIVRPAVVSDYVMGEIGHGKS